jgi:hypothetical protein
MAGLVQLMEAGKAERTKARQLAVQAGYVCMSRATIDRLAHPTVSQQPSLARGVCRRRVRAADTRTCVQACEIGPLVAMARTDCGLARVCQPIGQALKSSCKRTSISRGGRLVAMHCSHSRSLLSWARFFVCDVRACVLCTKLRHSLPMFDHRPCTTSSLTFCV